MWGLYKRECGKWLTEYVWVGPDDIVAHHRFVPLYGFVDNIVGQNLVGTHKSELRGRDGWCKVKTDMTQEQLPKGWLLL